MIAAAGSDRSDAPRTGFFPSIQGLRGLAALTVVCAHLYAMPMLAGFLPPLPGWLYKVFDTGGHGVELFFMISGFLIPASLVRHCRVSTFMYDRCLRILPVFVVLHLVVFTLGPIAGYKFFKGIDAATYVVLFVVNLLFLPDALGLPIAQQNAWTLSYEWAFYIWFAAMFVAYRAQSRWSMFALGLLALAAVGYRPNTAFFGIGIAFGLLSFRFPVKGWLGLGLALVSFVLMFGLMEYVSVWLALVPGFVFFAVVLTPESGLTGLLSTHVLQFVGKISYSMYLIHPFVLFPLQLAGRKLAESGVNLWLLWGGFALLGLTLVVIASTLSYEIIEVRLRRAIDRFLSRKWDGAQTKVQQRA
ncbi:acyltransferase family protein [Bradyrhizobium cosmicum]|uniref:Probable exopolysaccharide production protein n=1 Tax=Bradyrhizobium cosmicum TaxID=1404864 RepID=A0AAI8QEL4_9BRAD|nr:acyltransferase [Bradyrhizobium cosmicum]BAL78848.1 probable exopolysaccharide production protein [Bradyrhizobium cosmicum]